MQVCFAGGCFWCITPPLRAVKGVTRITAGYCGGEEASPVYEQVKAQKTGHRETVRVEYDENIVSFAQLMEVFLANVDPFDGGGQFIDRGASYTLAVYHYKNEQRAEALRQIAALEVSSGKKVCIDVQPCGTFWRAEEYHQNFDLKNPEALEKELIESGRKH